MSTMAAIVEEAAQPVAEFNPAVPAPLRWCLDRCLAKDREDRYHSTLDLQRELQTIRAHMDELSSSGRQPALAAAPPRKRRRWWPALVALASLVAGCAAWEAFLVPKSMVDLRAYQIQPLISTGAHEGDPAWSPDGKSMAYTAEVNGIRQVFARDLSSPMPAQITNSPVDCVAPFWSPDGARVYFLAPGAEVPGVWMVGSTGGSPELVQPGASAAALTPDGKTLAFLRSGATADSPLMLYFVARGGPSDRASRTYTGAPFSSGKYQSGYLRFSPDGATLGAWLARWDGASEFWALPYPDGAPRLAFSMALGAHPFSWMPGGRRVVFGAAMPGAVGVDLCMADIRSGELRRISALTRDTNQPAVSPDGKTIAFQAAEDNFEIVSAPLDGAATRGLVSTRGNDFDPMWAPPAGDQLVFVTDRTGVPQIWLKSLREGWERPLVTEKDFGRAWIAEFREPQFSPDGRRIAYTVAAGNGHSIYVSAVAGGKPLRLSPDATDERSATWSGDGAWIAFLQNVNGRWTLVRARSGGGDQPVVLLRGCTPTHPKWNPRENRIACTTSDGLTLVSDDGKQSNPVSPGEWLVYGWSLDGKMLYGVKRLAGGRRVVASVDPEKRVEKTLGDLQLPASAVVHGFSMAADGKSFATSYSHPGGDIWVLRGFEKPGIGERIR
jgi:Tol biopolymer transport system component